MEKLNSFTNTRRSFFSLKRKALVISIILLSLPFIGLQFLLQIESTLVKNLTEALNDYSQSLAYALAKEEYWSKKNNEPLASEPKPFYVSSISREVSTDGFTDDWFPLTAYQHQVNINQFEFSINFAEQNDSLIMMINVDDFEIAYRNVVDEFSVSDQVILTLIDDNHHETEFVFSPIGVGTVTPFIRSESFRSIWVTQAFWQESPAGYSLEIKIPNRIKWTGAKWTIKNFSSSDNSFTSYHYPVNGFIPLQRPDRFLENWLADLPIISGKRLWLVSPSGQVLASKGSLQSNLQAQAVNPLLHFLFAPPTTELDDPRKGAQFIQLPAVANALKGQISSLTESTSERDLAIALVAVPITSNHQIVGVLITEQSIASVQLIQQQALNIYLNSFMLVMLLVILILIFWGSTLLWRLLRLGKQTSEAIDPYGRIVKQIEPDTKKDEIGQVSQHIAQTHQKLVDYQDYLNQLGSRLSHELRTPLAMVRSSIDALSMQGELNSTKELTHARAGLERMSKLLDRMREAARLEQSIISIVKQPFQPKNFVAGYVEAFNSTAPSNKLFFSCVGEEKSLNSSDELWAQLLDKLISNAQDFAKEESMIEVSLIFSNSTCSILVINEGPPLPNIETSQLFSLLSSHRSEEHQQNKGHLGLGLYICKLIAEFHNGRCIARNIKDNKVMVGIEIAI